MHPSDLPFIGKVHSDILSIKDAPKFHAESDRTGTLEIFPKYQEGLKGIAEVRPSLSSAGSIRQTGTPCKSTRAGISQEACTVCLLPAAPCGPIPLPFPS